MLANSPMIALQRLEHITGPDEATGTLEAIYQRLSDGESLREIARDWAVPSGRLLTWIIASEERYSAYRRALAVAAHGLVAETLPIADAMEGEENAVAVSVAKLRIETRFRIAKFHAPDLYGESSSGGGNGGAKVTVIVNRQSAESRQDLQMSDINAMIETGVI